MQKKKKKMEAVSISVQSKSGYHDVTSRGRCDCGVAAYTAEQWNVTLSVLVTGLFCDPVLLIYSVRRGDSVSDHFQRSD